jgi:hypothetical protein
MVYPVPSNMVDDLAFSFEYRHVDGRDPHTYSAPLRRAIELWWENYPHALRSLRYRKGPGFLVIGERRPNLQAVDYTLGEREAAIYLACEDGATPAQAARAVREAGLGDVNAGEVRAYLDELTARRLLYKENDQYLALALPPTLPEAVLAGDFGR